MKYILLLAALFTVAGCTVLNPSYDYPGEYDTHFRYTMAYYGTSYDRDRRDLPRKPPGKPSKPKRPPRTMR